MNSSSGIPYKRIAANIALLTAAAVGIGFVWHLKEYTLFVVLIPIVGWAIFRLIAIYRDITRRIIFMFNAVENDDYTFRFSELPTKVDNSLLNASLNRIKFIMDNAKLKIREKDKYYELIMECAGVGIVTLNDTGSVYQANQEAIEMFALPRLSHINQIRRMAPNVAEALERIAAGEKRYVKHVGETGEMNLSLNCAEVELSDRHLRVVTISEISDEMTEKELESWSKLTRILTHEIMNSLAPITSLSQTLLGDEATADDIHSGLQTIAATSRRLQTFVDLFRRFTRIPAPQPEPFEVREMTEQTIGLVDTCGIEVEITIEPADTMIYADRMLTAQVMVNLLKNAVEACREKEGARIGICCRIGSNEDVTIEVSDNGGAIPADVAENIFTPFFTTKDDGSGIGLSVSRRIMQLQGGQIRLSQNTAEKVAFTLVFS